MTVSTVKMMNRGDKMIMIDPSIFEQYSDLKDLLAKHKVIGVGNGEIVFENGTTCNLPVLPVDGKYDVIKTYINLLVIYELNNAINLHDLFKNQHEFFSVLREEFEEVDIEIIKTADLIDQVWRMVKANDIQGIINHTTLVKSFAMNAISELAQVISVCMKLEKGFEIR